MFHLLTHSVVVLMLAACGSDPSYMNDHLAATGMSFVEVADPAEGAFTVAMPKGWKTAVGLLRPQGQLRSCGFALSPDGEACVFFGDPRMPSFYLPAPQYGMYAGMSLGSPMFQVIDYVPADRFFVDYVRRQYGHLPGFRVLGQAPNAWHQAQIDTLAARLGMQVRSSATSVAFTFIEDGKPVQAQVNGATYQVYQGWMADVYGFITSGDTSSLGSLATGVFASVKTQPQWQQQENARHQQMAEQSNLAHQQRMQQMQQNFNAHQERMKNLSAANDAYNEAWRQRQLSQDRQHDQFIDYIRGEETVTNGNQTAKVESGYNHYYVNPTDQTYIATDSPYQPDMSVYELWRRKY